MPAPSATTRVLKEANAEPIAGYRLIEPLGKGGFGEVWKCEAPGGVFKAIKFVHGKDEETLGDEVCNAEQELRALQHVKTIRHPFLLSIDRLEYVGGELVIVTELADKSLHDLLTECRAAGAAGIPRDDLLLYMRETAEVLDVMNQEYGLQHLDVKPRNLFLVHQHVKVADFGLVNSLADVNAKAGNSKLQLAAVTPLYAAPETFLGKITLFSDQYSLAVVYCELMTGKIPYTGKNFRQLALQHTSGKPDLSELPIGDQGVVAKAMSKDPRQRFGSCLEFVRALIAVPDHDLVRPSSETRSETRPPSAATMHDIDLVEKKHKTASIVRPTKSMRPVTVQPVGDDDSAGLDAFTFIECMGRTPLGELWRTESPEGKPCLVKLINTFNPGMGEATAAAQLRAIRHPGLVEARVVPHTSNRIAVITDPLRETVATRLQEARGRSQSGIPRLELLGYLLQTAQTLDELQRQYGLQHLGLTPKTIFLVEGEVRLADFGLMALVWIPGGQQPAQINSRYAAPELFQRRLSKHCDQYSLALIFYEMLTGDQVHGTRTPSQMAKVRAVSAVESLDLLPSPDRPIMARALNPEPDRRYSCCTDMIRALIENTPGGEELLHEDGWTTVRRGLEVLKPVELPEPPAFSFDREEAGRVVASLVSSLAGTREIREHRSAPYFFVPGEELEHVCYARLVPGTLRLKLVGFVEQWRVAFVDEQEDCFRFHHRLQSSLWRRVMGGQPGVEIEVRAIPPALSGSTMTQVRVRMKPIACGRDEGAAALEKWGPELMDSLRTHLSVGPERRKQPRLPFERELRVLPLLSPNRVGAEIEAVGKDISLDGIGLYLPTRPSAELVLRLRESDDAPETDVPARVVRVQQTPDGRCEVGLRFSFSAVR